MAAVASPRDHRVVEGGDAPKDTPPLLLGFYNTPETRDPTELEIIGNIPEWVKGSLYRGGHAGWDVGNYSSGHWFDGFSRNHLFEIRDGKVSYRSRNSSDSLIEFVRETGFVPGGTFGSDPCKSIFGEMETKFRDWNNKAGDKDKSNVQVNYIKNFPGLKSTNTQFGPLTTLVAITDANHLQQIDPVTLEPIELFTYQTAHPDLGSAVSCAHPSIGDNGEVFNYILNEEGENPVYQIFGVYPDGRGKILANITDAPSAYIHAVYGTENYIILIVWQADLDAIQVPNIVDRMKPWDPNRDALFYVIAKDGSGVVAKYTSPTFFAFHEINSFEKDGDIIIDLPWFENHSWVLGATMKNLRTKVGKDTSGAHDLVGDFVRFRLSDIAGGKAADGSLVTREATKDFHLPFAPANLELPQINEAYRARPYRYAYGVHIENRGNFLDSIVKVDTKTQETKVWKAAAPHLPGEPIFVPRPGAEAEDDGVLLFLAMEEKRAASCLIVADAQTMTEIGRANIPVVVGYGFHGTFV